MRNNDYINGLWGQGGPYVGDNKPHGRVTVQLPWPDLSGDHKYDVLRSTYDIGVGNYSHRGVPLRWFQNIDNSQPEMEVPNVNSIHLTRSIDSDAATFEIVIYNQQHYTNTAIPATAQDLGQPGYFTPTRGVSLDSQGRWGQSTNVWENILQPNALIRTYQGYGGTDKTIPQALADGNIMLTGIWMVDHVEVRTDGMITISGRDMMKLLIDQQLYPPLVPKLMYPLTYYRWQYFNVPVNASTRTETSTTTVTSAAGDKVTLYADSEVDRWYSYNYDIHGHHPTDSLDGNAGTYYLGVGNSRPDAAFAVDWIEYTCGEVMNSVYVHPWAGNYTMYVSVMEHGVWQGTDVIPYDMSELIGTQPRWVNTGANIPYVWAYGVPWETPQEYVLPRAYLADRVRISFRNLAYSGIGPWMYRAGVREFRNRASTTLVVGTETHTVTLQPLFLSACMDKESGYITCDTWQQIDAFGAARTFPRTGGAEITNDVAIAIRQTSTQKGYYVLTAAGGVTCYGDAVWHSDSKTDGSTPYGVITAIDMALTPSGNGYWIVGSTGGIYHYGDAATYTAVTPTNNGAGPAAIISCDSHPTTQGLWIMDSNGHVFVRGACTDYGSFSTVYNNPAYKTTPGEMPISLRRTSTGTGYWIMTNTGKVEAKGTATAYGGPPLLTMDGNWANAFWELIPHSDDSGYLVLKGDGYIYDFGVSPLTWYYGAPIPGTQAQQRKDGNYKDYVDIIRDLVLWSGFLFYDPALPANETPKVYGNLESTGSYSPEPLPTEVFDKHPVIDAIHSIKEAVGYLVWVDDEGAFRFESPNWWGPGNFDETGIHTNDLHQLDELVTLVNLNATVGDDVLRSMIIISSNDPDESLSTTVTTRLIPSSKKQLRGLVKPAMWVNGFFLKAEEQKIMAELIALHSWFQTRVGQVTCVANPCLQINDQVRIWERQASETYVHYVRGVDSTMDLDTGSYMMTVTTHWLGDETNWAIQEAGTFTSVNDPDDPTGVWAISTELMEWIRFQDTSKSGGSFGRKPYPIITSIAPGSQTGTGSGPA